MPTDSLPPSLYLIPTPLGNQDDFTLRALKILKSLQFVACEDTRQSAPLLKSINPDLRLFSAHEHNEHEAAEKIIQLLKNQHAVGLVTDAGTPAISDPGAKIVQKTREAGFSIVPLPGACAAITAFSASGFLTSSFTFLGFLPPQKTARRKSLKHLKTQNGAFIFYESPHRIMETCTDLAEIFPRRELFIARELTKMFEECVVLPSVNAPLWLKENPFRQKGEFVLVLNEGERENPLFSQAEQLLTLLLENGLGVKTAANITEKITGIPKKTAYAQALLLKNPR